MTTLGPGPSSKHHSPTVGTILGCVVGGVIGLALAGVAAYIVHRRIRRRPGTIEPYPIRPDNLPKASGGLVEVPVNRLRPVHSRVAARPTTGNSSFVGGAPTTMYDASIRAVSALGSPRSSQPTEATVLLQEILRRVQRLGDSESEEPPPGYWAE